MKSRPFNEQDIVSALESSGASKPITETDLDDLKAAIAEAAYYRAEQRGFEPGYEITDWLEAEKEVKAMHS
jgi:hypothetical protein